MRAHTDGVLTQAVGGGPETPRIEWYETEVYRGDRLLLCTVGVSWFITDADLEAILSSPSGGVEVADAVVTRVLATEAADNLTVVVAEIA